MQNRKITQLLAIFSLVSFTLFSVPLDGAQAQSQTYPTLTLRVKWGNVEGEAITKEKTSFDGSVEVGSGSLKLIQRLRFEWHDWIVRKNTQEIVWHSDIYGGRDGLKIKFFPVSQDSELTINTAQGALSTNAYLLLQADKHIKSLDNGREIVIEVVKVNPTPTWIKVSWGHLYGEPASTAPVSFNGSLEFVGRGGIESATPYLFEGQDALTYLDNETVKWNSTIWGHNDGLYLYLDPGFINKNNPMSLKVSFTGEDGVSYEENFDLLELLREGSILRNVLVNGEDLGHELKIEALNHY